MTSIYGGDEYVNFKLMDHEHLKQPTSPHRMNDWPGIAVEEIGHPLVRKGKNFVDDVHKYFMEYLDELLTIYEARPDKINKCGIRINHALALFLTIKVLQPTTIVESGINAGQSTYLMRAASPVAHTYAIDPLVKPICDQGGRWMDSAAAQNKTTYYSGTNFQDLGRINLFSKINSGEVDPQKTLVFLDDHQKVFDRWNVLMKYGFRHVLLEDNYKAEEGGTKHDKAGWTPKQMFARKDADSNSCGTHWNPMPSSHPS